MEKCTKLSQIFPFLRGGGDMCSSHILGGSAFVAFGRNEEVPPPLLRLFLTPSHY